MTATTKWQENAATKAVCVVIISILAIPAVAWANAGTPLMWAGMLHLLVGNFIIGLVEAFVVSRRFVVSKDRLYSLSILGNYLSMIAGFAVLEWAGNHAGDLILGPQPLYHGVRLLVVLVGAAYLMSVIIEWPFFHFGLQKETRTARTSFRASVLAQTVSYVLLILFYMLPSGFSLYTQARLTHSLDFVNRKDAIVYFISPNLNGVYRLRLDGNSPERVVGLKPSNSNTRLFVRRSQNGQSWDLWVLDAPDYGHSTNKDERLLRKNFAAHTALDWHAVTGYGEEVTWFNFGVAADLRSSPQTNWMVSTGFWPVDGLSAINEQTRESMHLCVEMPFLGWIARNATILPGDQVVYQLGNQIVILDLSTRKLAFLALGQGPVVGLPSP
jgi:hypothetical protein